MVNLRISLFPRSPQPYWARYASKISTLHLCVCKTMSVKFRAHTNTKHGLLLQITSRLAAWTLCCNTQSDYVFFLSLSNISHNNFILSKGIGSAIDWTCEINCEQQPVWYKTTQLVQLSTVHPVAEDRGAPMMRMHFIGREYKNLRRHSVVNPWLSTLHMCSVCDAFIGNAQLIA